jgi:Protein of unknown function (DUF1559)
MRLRPVGIGLKLPLIILLSLLFNGGLAAQESAVGPPAIVFDLNINRLSQSQLLQNVPFPKGMVGGNFLAAKRFYGVSSFPSSLSELLQMQPGSPLSIDFLLVGEFDSKHKREQFISDAMVENSEKTQYLGKSYFVAPESADLLLSLGDTRIEGGSKDYLALPRSSILSLQLKAAMAELGNAPAKVVLDLTDSKEIVDEAIAMLRQQGVSALIAPFLELPQKMDQLRLAIDPNSSTLVNLLIKSGNANDAAFVKKSLEGVQGIARMAAAQAPRNLPATELMEALLGNVSIALKENQVSLTINRPAGFDELVAESLRAAQQSSAQMEKQNDLRQLLLAMHNYEAVYKTIPFRHEVKGHLSGQLSWRVKILPFIEQLELYQKFKVDQPWDSADNKSLAAQCPSILGSNGLANVCWIESGARNFQDITDGLSNTICLIENPKGTPWTQPKDLTIEEVESRVLGLADGASLTIGLYDGSVRTIDNKINKQTLRALLTINGFEAIDKF